MGLLYASHCRAILTWVVSPIASRVAGPLEKTEEFMLLDGKQVRESAMHHWQLFASAECCYLAVTLSVKQQEKIRGNTQDQAGCHSDISLQGHLHPGSSILLECNNVLKSGRHWHIKHGKAGATPYPTRGASQILCTKMTDKYRYITRYEKVGEGAAGDVGGGSRLLARHATGSGDDARAVLVPEAAGRGLPSHSS